MPNDFIDLGCGLDSPGSPMGAMPDKKSYPGLHFTCDEPINLPEGDFTFHAKGRKVMHSADTTDPQKPRHRYEIEVHGIKPMTSGTKKADPATDVAGALDKAIKSRVAAKMESDTGEE